MSIYTDQATIPDGYNLVENNGIAFGTNVFNGASVIDLLGFSQAALAFTASHDVAGGNSGGLLISFEYSIDGTTFNTGAGSELVYNVEEIEIPGGVSISIRVPSTLRARFLRLNVRFTDGSNFNDGGAAIGDNNNNFTGTLYLYKTQLSSSEGEIPDTAPSSIVQIKDSNDNSIEAINGALKVTSGNTNGGNVFTNQQTASTEMVPGGAPDTLLQNAVVSNINPTSIYFFHVYQAATVTPDTTTPTFTCLVPPQSTVSIPINITSNNGGGIGLFFWASTNSDAAGGVPATNGAPNGDVLVNISTIV